MNQEQESEFKKTAEEALDRVCFRDEHGNFYSLAAWMVLSIFLSMF